MCWVGEGLLTGQRPLPGVGEGGPAPPCASCPYTAAVCPPAEAPVSRGLLKGLFYVSRRVWQAGSVEAKRTQEKGLSLLMAPTCSVTDPHPCRFRALELGSLDPKASSLGGAGWWGRGGVGSVAEVEGERGLCSAGAWGRGPPSP